MRFLPQLFARNQAWAAGKHREQPDFFARLSAEQRPEYLWIGCSDSRVPANTIVDLEPGELFVHRNVANIVAADDINGLAAIQFAVEELGVGHIIVCGHYGCGGVLAALRPEPACGALGAWLEHVRAVRRAADAELRTIEQENARWRRLCELNVMAQVHQVCRLGTVREAWARRQPLVVHGWIYDLHDGLLRDLDVSRASSE